MVAPCRRASRRFKELIAGQGLPAELVPELLQIAWPRCGDWYCADLDPDAAEHFDLEVLEWVALVWLERECSDHAHGFPAED